MGYDCPTCGRTFESERGRGVHHSEVHGERLPNRECQRCGEQFYSKHEQRYCSEDCRVEAVSFDGSENPNYRGGKATTECELCGDRFEYYESEKEGKYCPDCVEKESWQDTVALEGEENPRWKGGKWTFECAVCGDEIERYPAEVTGEVTVCGRECLGEWLSEAFRGSDHPNWKGGDTGRYGPGWNRVRRQALERDGFQCVLCGAGTADIGRNPDVHHIVPVRTFEQSETHDLTDAHFLTNVVSLCQSCHRKADFGDIEQRSLLDAIDSSRSEWLRQLQSNDR